MGCSLGSKVQGDGGSQSGSKPGRKLSERELAQEKNEEYRAIMAFLGEVPLFQRLPKDRHPILASACIPWHFEAGQAVIKQGENGCEFFVIRSGEAQVLVSDGHGSFKQVATLQSGDYFGEKALLRNEPRTATVKALTEISTLKITREKFQELNLHEQVQCQSRKAVAGGAGTGEIQVRPPCKKTTEEKRLIAEALQRNANMQVIVSLTEARMEELACVAWTEFVPEGQELIQEGDLMANYFYIVKEGSFQVHKKMASTVQSAEDVVTRRDSSKVATIEKGGSFGELALLYSAPRSATVQALEDSVVWVIDRNNFKSILMKVSKTQLKQYVQYLDQCKLLDELTVTEKHAIAKAMVEVHFKQDEVILRQGEPGNTFYVMYEGEVSVIVDGVEKVRLRAGASQRTAQPFGERALLTNEPRAATVQVKSRIALALALDKESFDLLLGPLEDIFKQRTQTQASSCLPCWPCFGSCRRQTRPVTVRSRASMATYVTGKAKAARTQEKNRGQVQRKDLQRIGLLGCGAFGAVELWEHRETGASYAMKVLSKGYIVKMGMQESVMTEKFVLQMTNSSFIIALFETFTGKQHLYFLLEPALGGELHATYNRKGFHGSEEHAKYYIGGVVSAFEHFHERRIIYRDLKPENLMLNEKGHLKVTDMGLSKFVIGKTYTTCGTPDYFAPELLASTGHTHALDWWTLGILLFELMTGHPPFEAETHMQIFTKVTKGINKVHFPANVQGSLQDLVKAVLQKEPSMRLPMRHGGAQNLKDHAWFAGFSWEALEALTMRPPYMPVVRSRTDLANFSVGKEDLPPKVEYADDGSGWDNDFASST